MTHATGRTVTAAVTSGDDCLGVVGPFAVTSPWWADVEPVVAHLRARLGVPVVVLRLVEVTGGTAPRDGHVTYHVEALARPGGRLPNPPGHDCAALRQPAVKRAPWATAAGAIDALDWALRTLRAAGRPATGPAEQVKTWNLSALFRIPTVPGPVWLKITPGFATFEPDAFDLVARVDAGLVPTVIAVDPPHRRMLMEHVPGEDCWDASPEIIRTVVRRWVDAQAGIVAGAAVARLPTRTTGHLITGHLIEGLDRLLSGEAGRGLAAGDARRLTRRLPALIDALQACGLPDTLVHGDFQPGNWRSDGDRAVLVDFADAHLGHPAFDAARLHASVPPAHRGLVAEAWCRAWLAHAPAADPARALASAAPLGHLSGAVLYQEFLDNIEHSERRYHEGDPAAGIRAAMLAARELT